MSSSINEELSYTYTEYVYSLFVVEIVTVDGNNRKLEREK